MRAVLFGAGDVIAQQAVEGKTENMMRVNLSSSVQVAVRVMLRLATFFDKVC